MSGSWGCSRDDGCAASEAAKAEGRSAGTEVAVITGGATSRAAVAGVTGSFLDVVILSIIVDGPGVPDVSLSDPSGCALPLPLSFPDVELAGCRFLGFGFGRGLDVDGASSSSVLSVNNFLAVGLRAAVAFFLGASSLSKSDS